MSLQPDALKGDTSPSIAKNAMDQYVFYVT